MEGEIKELLRLALNKILEKPFKSFKRRLSEYEHSEYNTIARSDLENKDREEVVDLIISQYTTHDGPEVVVRILEDINERQVSAVLLEWLAASECSKKRKTFNTDPAAHMERSPILIIVSSPPTQPRRVNPLINHTQPAQQVSYNPPPMRVYLPD